MRRTALTLELVNGLADAAHVARVFSLGGDAASASRRWGAWPPLGHFVQPGLSARVEKKNDSYSIT